METSEWLSDDIELGIPLRTYLLETRAAYIGQKLSEPWINP